MKSSNIQIVPLILVSSGESNPYLKIGKQQTNGKMSSLVCRCHSGFYPTSRIFIPPFILLGWIPLADFIPPCGIYPSPNLGVNCSRTIWTIFTGESLRESHNHNVVRMHSFVFKGVIYSSEDDMRWEFERLWLEASLLHRLPSDVENFENFAHEQQIDLYQICAQVFSNSVENLEWNPLSYIFCCSLTQNTHSFSSIDDQ